MCVHNVMDQWFNTSRDTCWEFYVDTLPPEAWCIGEYDTIVDIEEFDTMMFELFDLDAGVNESTIVLDVRVQSCTTGTNETFSFSMDDPSLVYDSTQNLLKLDISNNPSFFLYRGDSLFFSLKYAGDLTTVCYPNMLEDYYMCVKFIKPITRCYASPQPFTPNMDGYNDELSFDYPGRYDFEGKVFVYDLRSRLVAEINVSGPRKYIWDGRDINRVSVRPGVYLYVITGQGGKVLCRGTVVLAR